MKTLSTLLIGAFMLASVNSAIAIEGDFRPLNNSAINAAKQLVAEQRIGEIQRKCAVLPTPGEAGTQFESVCYDVHVDGATSTVQGPDYSNHP